MRTYEEVSQILDCTINEIFPNKSFKHLPKYERRRKIFEHLSSVVDYDYEMLSQIKESETTKKRIL